MPTEPPRLARIVGLFADLHGERRSLVGALVACRAAGVGQIALLGDLFDRIEQADACADALAGWPTIGVWGNHEREIALAAATAGILAPATVALLIGLREELVVDEVCLTHEATHWGRSAALARLVTRPAAPAPPLAHDAARITFAGHTHHRAARDERGPLDLGRGLLTLEPARRYLINPGALAVGQYAIWDRDRGVVRFCHTE